MKRLQLKNEQTLEEFRGQCISLIGEVVESKLDQDDNEWKIFEVGKICDQDIPVLSGRKDAKFRKEFDAANDFLESGEANLQKSFDDIYEAKGFLIGFGYEKEDGTRFSYNYNLTIPRDQETFNIRDDSFHILFYPNE